jgi:Spy/CpxP family protein refolding chaperone
MKKLTVTLMAAVFGLLFTSQVLAWGPGFGPGRGGGYGNCREAGLERLNLTDEQKTKIEALETATQKELRPIREKMFDKSVALRRLWLQANPAKDKIISLQKEVRVLRDELQDKTTASRFEIRKILTPEQQEKLTGFGWGRGSGFGPRGGMRGYGGRGPGMGYCQ